MSLFCQVENFANFLAMYVPAFLEIHFDSNIATYVCACVHCMFARHTLNEPLKTIGFITKTQFT